jgi:hypothetical protein
MKILLPYLLKIDSYYQNTDYSLKIMNFRIKSDRLNLFLLALSIGKTKLLDILDLAMVRLGVLFETIKSKNILRGGIHWLSGGPSLNYRKQKLILLP